MKKTVERDSLQSATKAIRNLITLDVEVRRFRYKAKPIFGYATLPSKKWNLFKFNLTYSNLHRTYFRLTVVHILAIFKIDTNYTTGNTSLMCTVSYCRVAIWKKIKFG